MNKKQFENENFVLYSPDSLNYLTKDMEIVLDSSLQLYKRIFSVENYRKIQINYFDNIELFRNFIYELRGERESLPKYAEGTFDKGMINAYIRDDLVEGTKIYNKKKYLPSHELFHIMYRKLILKRYNMPRIVWFDEGMAQLFSGEYDENLRQENYDSFVRNVIQNTKKIPNLNELTHGAKFKTDDYCGYKLSFIAVKCIYDRIGMEKFKELMHDTEKIRQYGENILSYIFKNKEMESDVHR